MYKPWKLLLVIALVSVLLLQGCGSGGSSGASGVSLTMTAWGNPAELKVYQRAIDAYMEKYPDVSVKLVPVPSDGYEQKLLTQLAGGSGSDVFYVGDETMAKLISNQSIEPLSGFLTSGDSFVKADEFAEGLWGAAKRGEEIYGLPVDNNPLLLYYNIDLFKEAGLKSPQEYYDAGEWNWKTFEEVTSRLKETGKKGFVIDSGWSYVISWIWSNGGDMYDAEGNYVMDRNDKVMEAIAYLHKLVADGNMTYAGSLPKGQGNDAMFLSNQVGMVAAGRWMTPMFSENPNLHFDYIPYPTNTGNKMEPAAIATAYLSLNQNSKQKEEAKKFLTFYVSAEGQKARLSGMGNAVPSVGGIDDIVTADGIPPHSQYLIDVRENGYANGANKTKSGQIPGLGDEVKQIYDLLFLQQIGVDEAVKRITEMVAKKTAEASSS